MRLRMFSLVVLSAAASARGEVFSSEFNSLPLDEGWQLLQQYCDPVTWIEAGWYHQQLDLEGCPPPEGDQDTYRRTIEEFNGVCNIGKTVGRASATTNAGNKAKPVKEVLPFLEISMSISSGSCCAEVLPRSDFGKVF